MALLRVSLLKLVRRPATYVVFGILAAILVLFFLALGFSVGQTEQMGEELQIQILLRFPTAYTMVVGFILGFGGLLAAAYAAAVIGADWAWGTIRAIIARGESRVRYTLITFAAVAIVLLAGVIVSFLIGVGAAAAAATIGGVSTDGATDPDTLATLPGLLARTWLGVVQAGAIGFAIAMLFKSQLAGIGAALALYFAETFLALVPTLDEVLAYFPYSVSSAVIATTDELTEGGFGDAVSTLDADTAVLWSIGYIVAALLVASLALRRAQITQ
jgi:ABC-type transport system involved in multi-copper enzyme maturation permease subunit